MLRVLVPVDGSETSMRAVRHACRTLSGVADARVELVNVQPPLPQAATKWVAAENLESYHRDEARSALGEAEAELGRNGIAFASHVVVGPVAENIVRLAGELRCTQIVMGTRGLSAVTGLLMGSTATKVVHLAEMPVTLVK